MTAAAAKLGDGGRCKLQRLVQEVALSGAHFNPAVSLVMAVNRGLLWRELAPYVGARSVGNGNCPTSIRVCGGASGIEPRSSVATP